MICIDCKWCITDNINGVVDMFCTKHKVSVCAYDKCRHSKKWDRYIKIKNIYMDNYKTKTYKEIAKMCGIKRNVLYQFVLQNCLPQKNIEK